MTNPDQNRDQVCLWLGPDGLNSGRGFDHMLTGEESCDD